MKLIILIHQKIGENIQNHILFISKKVQVAIIRFELTEADQIICMELFK
jgi:hypothetical protein